MPRYQYRKDLERVIRQEQLAMSEPWHIEPRTKSFNPFMKECLTKHQATLKNIMKLEHDLDFHIKPDDDCDWCWYDGKLNGIVPSHYDPTIEGVICR